ncbi:MAG: helix-turn-helix domain-containing protein [Bryobacterales bacterium]|nr:helix-turn-helix domain-containing protein [Bryobacterales bacterium]
MTATRNTTNDWHTITALAARTGLSRKTVWAWIRDGKLRSHRCGAQHRIAECDWQQFLAACNWENDEMDHNEMNMTPEDQETFDWCCAVLNEEQFADCEDEAAELAGAEIHQQEAANLLVPLLKRLMVQNVGRELMGRNQ